MTAASEDKFRGSFLGLALGDALGARHEGGPIARALWWALGLGKGGALRWSDDTDMTLGLAKALVEKGGFDADHAAGIWANRVDWKRGYGSGTRKLLNLIRGGVDWREANRRIFPTGSYGNGAAMRAAPLGLFYNSDESELVRVAELASSVTHAHPLGIEGGVLIARATASALKGDLDLDHLRSGCRQKEFLDALDSAKREMDRKEVRKLLGNGVQAHRSAVTAVYAARRFTAFMPMVEFVNSLGGDTDTIAAMAGGILGARYGTGVLPVEPMKKLEARAEIEDTARALYAASSRA